MGIIVPTAAATVFELGLLLGSESGPSLQELLGRVALMAVAATTFSLIMFTLIGRNRRALMSQQRKFQDLFRSSPDAILLVDERRYVTALNPKAEELFGYSDRAPAFDLCRLCLPPSGQRCPSECPLSGQQPVFRTTVRKADGNLMAVVGSASQLPANSEGQVETVLRFSDISTLESQEQARISRLLTRRTMEAREEERRRLARDLHDGIGQELYALRLALEASDEPADRMAQNLMEEVDKLAKQLWPPVLDKLGLVRALEATFDSLENVSVKAPEPFPQLELPLRAALFRIAQEAVTNALKHGQPAKVAIELTLTEQEVIMTVVDDGEGFQAESEESVDGLGLASMRERAELAGGVCQVHSRPGQGARIEVQLPRGRSE